MDKKILMKNLGITADQAKELMAADNAVDKMNRVADINSDLTPEQIKAAKKARSAGRKRTTYKFDTSKREKKINEPKKEIIADLIGGLGPVENINITNNEREFTFVKDGIKYKVVLSVPRS